MKPVGNQGHPGFYQTAGSDGSNNPFDMEAGGRLMFLTTHLGFFFHLSLFEMTEAAQLAPTT